MLSQIFLGLSLLGAEWVLYILIVLSVVSVALMIERARFYRSAMEGLQEFRARIRTAATTGKWEEALQAAQARRAVDLESGLAAAMLTHSNGNGGGVSSDVLAEVAHDEVVRAKLHWEKNLTMLATIGSNAPFIGLFGTVLGIIKAFHDLSQQAGAGAQTVTAGISEALVATAVGILVAIPAVVAYNLFQRKVKTALAEAEAMKSFLVGKLAK